MIELPDIKKLRVDIDKIEPDLTKEKNVSLSILRLDKIHPEIQGNKFFKLYYFLKEAVSQQKLIVTFGGAYSNHLAATANACNMLGITSIAIVRGEQPKELSHTLLYCKEHGMQLEFISRDDYRKKNDQHFRKKLTNRFGEHVLIPEGGYCKEGMEGAALIPYYYKDKNYTHICCATGTVTTLAGLINSSQPSQNILGFNSLKGTDDFESRINFLLEDNLYKNYFLMNDYHFGGLAKKTSELIYFMNNFFKDFSIPTDFVYTAKMMFGVFDLISKNYFPENSNILCIHTGGLQGNLSLPPVTLNF